MMPHLDDLIMALSAICAAEARWRNATEASGRLAADAELRLAAARGREALNLAEPGSAEQWVATHLED